MQTTTITDSTDLENALGLYDSNRRERASLYILSKDYGLDDVGLANWFFCTEVDVILARAQAENELNDPIFARLVWLERAFFYFNTLVFRSPLSALARMGDVVLLGSALSRAQAEKQTQRIVTEFGEEWWREKLVEMGWSHHQTIELAASSK